MKRRVQLLLTCLVMAAVLTGCQAAAEPHEGEAEGYGGTLRVRVRTNGTDVTAVEVIEHHETEGVGTRAIDVMPDAIVRSDTPDVDGVSGATRTSDAIRAAVRMALGQTATPSSMDAPTASPARRSGVGMAASAHAPREGSSDQGFSVVVASADFDAEGRILSVMMDEMEIVTPGGSENRPAFSGFPTDDGDQERFRQEVASFTSKRAQGDAYRMPKGTWAEQMDAYELLMEEIFLQGFSDQVSELNLSNPDSLYLITTDGYTAHLGDMTEMRAKIGTVRAVVAKLREMGKEGGVIEASVPAVATYTPSEL